MKRILKLLLILIALLAIALLALQIFLNRGLNPVIQKALPEISKSVGLDVGVGNASLNLFGGSLKVNDLSINNPKGFEFPTVFALEKTVLDVSLRALTKGILEVSEATVLNATVSLVRNQEGDLNLKKIQEARPESKPATKPTAQPKPTKETASPTEAIEIPKVQLNHLAFNTLFEFIDYKTTNTTPLRVGFDLVIKAKDISTFGSKPEAQWGTLSIGGTLHDNPETFVTDITASVAPLCDPQHASFTALGNIMNVDMRKIESLTHDIGIACSTANLTIQLTVRDGIFMTGSELVLRLRDAELSGKLKKKHGDVKLPPDLSITIPVSGDLSGPIISMQQAITVSILRNLTQNPDYLLDNVTVDGKSLRDKLNKALGGGSKKKNDADASKDDALEETVNDAVKKLGDLFK